MFMNILIGVAIYFIGGLLVFNLCLRGEDFDREAKNVYELSDKKISFNLCMFVMMLTIMITWLPLMLYKFITGKE